MTKHVRSPCDKLLASVDYWHLGEDGGLIAFIDDNAVPVEDNELTADYPLLPVAIRGLIEKLSSPYTRPARATGEDVIQTAYLLKYGPVSFVDLGYVSRHVTSVVGLSLASGDAIVVLTCSVVALGYVENAGQKVPYAMRSDRRDVKVARRSLDARYPGWYERWTFGAELGLEMQEVMQMTFSNAPTSLSEHFMSTLTFD